MHIDMWCPKRRHGGAVDTLVCFYSCPVGTKVKCSEFARRWEQIKDLPVEQKYLEKYGEPVRPVPLMFRKRRKRRTTPTE